MVVRPREAATEMEIKRAVEKRWEARTQREEPTHRPAQTRRPWGTRLARVAVKP
jgi:negative regulator of sigma E activity